MPGAIVSAGGCCAGIGIGATKFKGAYAKISVARSSIAFSGNACCNKVKFPFGIGATGGCGLSLAVPVNYIKCVSVSRGRNSTFMDPLKAGRVLGATFSDNRTKACSFAVAPTARVVVVYFTAARTRGVAFSGVSLGRAGWGSRMTAARFSWMITFLVRGVAGGTPVQWVKRLDEDSLQWRGHRWQEWL